MLQTFEQPRSIRFRYKSRSIPFVRGQLADTTLRVNSCMVKDGLLPSCPRSQSLHLNSNSLLLPF